MKWFLKVKELSLQFYWDILLWPLAQVEYFKLRRISKLKRSIYPIEQVAPEGMYCYTPIKINLTPSSLRSSVRKCPFWGYNKFKYYQEAGYCHYKDYYDGDKNGTSLLWDQVKEIDECMKEK